ncbi:MAG TPA: erythromycin esterase family protein, partial [Thermoanaerobaculia bacterium]|nr:erythromycin esterase family protein [Thermoanaerobaculia bacterium]
MRRALALVLLAAVSLPLAARVRAVRSAAEVTPESWLRQRAVDDAGFVHLARNASVVALGDATHGTHEIYAAKQRLVPLLVDEGFRTIAFEAPYAEWAKLDEYVVHGTGDPAAALNFRLYWFWDTDEILHLIEWARAQNAAGLTPPIRIAGVDSTEPASAA